MKYIVTGATSCIGSAVVSYLLSNGDEVFAIIRPNSPKEEWLLSQVTDDSQLTLIHLDLNSICDLPDYFNSRADVFLNFAWAGTSKEARNSRVIQQQNADNAISAIKCASKIGCRLYVEAGSQAEYGRQNGLTREDSICDPYSEYGKAKLRSGIEGKDTARKIGISYIHLRIFSVYGEGELKDTLISSCITNMLEGKHVSLTSCTQKWNYLYRSDAARMICTLSSIIYHKNESTYEILNIASTDTRPLQDFVEEIRAVLGYPSEPGYGEIRVDNPLQLDPSISKALSIIGDFSFTSFTDGIKNKIDFYKRVSCK